LGVGEFKSEALKFWSEAISMSFSDEPKPDLICSRLRSSYSNYSLVCFSSSECWSWFRKLWNSSSNLTLS
jgi:hypothetical protein